jgi:hypothetical protein
MMKRSGCPKGSGKSQQRFRGIGTIFVGILLWAMAAYGATDAWTGGPSDNYWSTGDNWSTGLPPGASDSAVFNADDSGNVNVVDLDFTIARLWYWRNGTHTMDLNGTSALQVNGPVDVGLGGSTDGATVTWTNGGSVTVGTAAAPKNFQIGYNSTASGTNVSSLSLNGVTMDTWVDKFVIGANDYTGGSDGRLTLGSGSQLRVEGITSTPTNRVMIGHNSGSTGTSTGVLEALQGTADLHMNELDVGFNEAGGGSATGTLRWNQTTPIDARYVYFGRGTNATGNLDVPSGGTLQLGTAADPIYTLMAAWNTGVGTASANLDFSVNDPTFTMYADGGFVAGLNDSTGTANGRLVLGDNSRVYAGTPTAPTSTSVTIGSNRNGSDGAAIGAFDGSHGVAQLHVYEVLVGDNKSGSDSAALGTATGTLTTGTQTTLTADKVQIARGPGTTGTVNMNGGLFAAQELNLRSAGATFNFNGGRLAASVYNTYNGTGSLAQHGGTLAPGFDLADRSRTALAGKMIVSGNYLLDTAGALEIELFGSAPGTEYDQLRVDGLVNLAADGGDGGALDLLLNFSPAVGDQFTIIDNDSVDLIAGHFAGLSNLAMLSESYLGATYEFQISYAGGTGNDVVLTMTRRIDEGIPVTIPAPGALLLGSLGAGVLGWLRHRRFL